MKTPCMNDSKSFLHFKNISLRNSQIVLAIYLIFQLFWVKYLLPKCKHLSQGGTCFFYKFINTHNCIVIEPGLWLGTFPILSNSQEMWTLSYDIITSHCERWCCLHRVPHKKTLSLFFGPSHLPDPCSTQRTLDKNFQLLYLHITGTALSTLLCLYIPFLSFLIPVNTWLIKTYNHNRKSFINSHCGTIYLKYLSVKTHASVPQTFLGHQFQYIHQLTWFFSRSIDKKPNKWPAGPTSLNRLSLKEHSHVTELEQENVT
jgi:hypothetical protein